MLKQRGLSTTAIGFTSAFPYLVASIGMIAWSFSIDRSRAYLGNYVIACVAAGGFALSVAVDSLPIMIIGISLALVGMNSHRPAIFSLLPRFLQGAAAAAGMAFVNSVGNLGGFFGPYMIASPVVLRPDRLPICAASGRATTSEFANTLPSVELPLVGTNIVLIAVSVSLAVLVRAADHAEAPDDWSTAPAPRA
jgi:hypothetical protein